MHSKINSFKFSPVFFPYTSIISRVFRTILPFSAYWMFIPSIERSRRVQQSNFKHKSFPRFLLGNRSVHIWRHFNYLLALWQLIAELGSRALIIGSISIWKPSSSISEMGHPLTATIFTHAAISFSLLISIVIVFNWGESSWSSLIFHFLAFSFNFTISEKISAWKAQYKNIYIWYNMTF